MNLSYPHGIIGIDIGGANLKLSDGERFNLHEPFALWQHPDTLTQKLAELLNHAPQHDLVAVTMTGELTDCFANKREGVHFITNSIVGATNAQVRIYLQDGRFAEPDVAMSEYMLAAASNWHALAKLAATSIAKGKPGILIDTGSTTTDIIPFREGDVNAVGADDFGRLVNGELVYTATVRTSLAGIVKSVIHRGAACPVMNELFATTLDTNIVLGHFPAGAHPHYAADGEPTEMENCVRRIARLIGKDDLTFDLQDAEEIARQIFESQISMIHDAAIRVASKHAFDDLHVVVSGQGEFLAKAVCQHLKDDVDVAKVISLGESLGPLASTCATAWAISNLAKQSGTTIRTNYTVSGQ